MGAWCLVLSALSAPSPSTVNSHPTITSDFLSFFLPSLFLFDNLLFSCLPRLQRVSLPPALHLLCTFLLLRTLFPCLPDLLGRSALALRTLTMTTYYHENSVLAPIPDNMHFPLPPCPHPSPYLSRKLNPLGKSFSHRPVPFNLASPNFHPISPAVLLPIRACA